jgi:hypothetical protein
MHALSSYSVSDTGIERNKMWSLWSYGIWQPRDSFLSHCPPIQLFPSHLNGLRGTIPTCTRTLTDTLVPSVDILSHLYEMLQKYGPNAAPAQRFRSGETLALRDFSSEAALACAVPPGCLFPVLCSEELN